MLNKKINLRYKELTLRDWNGFETVPGEGECVPSPLPSLPLLPLPTSVCLDPPELHTTLSRAPPACTPQYTDPPHTRQRTHICRDGFITMHPHSDAPQHTTYPHTPYLTGVRPEMPSEPGIHT